MGFVVIPTPCRRADFTEDSGGIRDMAPITKLKF